MSRPLARLELLTLVAVFYGPVTIFAVLNRLSAAASPDATQPAGLLAAPDIVDGYLYALPRLAILYYVARAAHLDANYFGLFRPKSALLGMSIISIELTLGLLLGNRPAALDLLTGAATTAWSQQPSLFLGNAGYLILGALFEEFARAYVINRTQDLTGRRWLGSTAALLLFSLGHLYYVDHKTLAGVLVTGGLLYTFAYHRYRDVWALVIAHAGMNMLVTLHDLL